MLFLLPVALLLIALEVMVHTVPNSYSYKYNYVKTKGKDIKAVAIGHSQFYDDFKSDSFFLPSFNLSNSAQGYMEDYYLLRELLPDMPNLEMVLLPIGYMNVGREEMFTQKSCYYHEYMNIDYDGKLPLEYRFEGLFVRSSVKKILSYYLMHQDIVKCDSLGWANKYLKDRKYELGHDRVIDIYTLNEGEPFFLAGEEYLFKIIDLLKERNIQMVLVSPPLFWECYDRTNWEQKAWADAYIQNLLEDYPGIKYVDMEFDTSFWDEDYIDESHLCDTGAEKFIQKLNQALSVN